MFKEGDRVQLREDSLHIRPRTDPKRKATVVSTGKTDRIVKVHWDGVRNPESINEKFIRFADATDS